MSVMFHFPYTCVCLRLAFRKRVPACQALRPLYRAVRAVLICHDYFIKGVITLQSVYLCGL